MKPIFFVSPAEWRAWLDRHHQTCEELLVGFHRKETGRPSLTWPQSVDEALCYGWIDGVRRSVDATRYTIRFTPRRAGSTWSLVNVKRVGELTRQGLMQPAGLAVFTARKKTATASYEQRRDAALSPEHIRRFKRNPVAWKYFQAQPPGYRRLAAWFVVSAKLDATRARRLDHLIETSAKGKRLS